MVTFPAGVSTSALLPESKRRSKIGLRFMIPDNLFVEIDGRDGESLSEAARYLMSELPGAKPIVNTAQVIAAKKP